MVGPCYLRWALIEAAQHAGPSSRYYDLYKRKRAQHPGSRGTKIAAICVGRKLAEAIWHMLTRDQPFAPAGATPLWPHDGPRRRCATARAGAACRGCTVVTGSTLQAADTLAPGSPRPPCQSVALIYDRVGDATGETNAV